MNKDFSIIDRLVAFGIEASFATQMMSTMNGMISKMAIPGSVAGYRTTNKSEDKAWFVRIDDKTVGPANEKDMMSYLLNRKIDKDTLVWSIGMPEWKRVEEVPEILKLLILLPPEL